MREASGGGLLSMLRITRGKRGVEKRNKKAFKLSANREGARSKENKRSGAAGSCRPIA